MRCTLVACGGFSYSDVLGAGEGWTKSVLFNPRVRVTQALAEDTTVTPTFAEAPSSI
ncbi:hypothetical protein D8L93_09035 [Sodalis-like symbiont of Bactericera trigonica]|nr:hypothetical protein D8L93_09035 [Sodalis-like symbiont of Bactericera trigonica]